MSPTIEIVTVPEDDMDENTVGLKDFTSFGFVNFDIYPHYEKDREDIIIRYEQETGREVKRLRDEDVIVVEKHHML